MCSLVSGWLLFLLGPFSLCSFSGIPCTVPSILYLHCIAHTVLIFVESIPDKLMLVWLCVVWCGASTFLMSAYNEELYLAKKRSTSEHGAFCARSLSGIVVGDEGMFCHGDASPFYSYELPK